MNKDAEKRVLRMAYNETEFSVVDETGERPDFILKDIYGIEFGVEITEYYNSESAARLTNAPNYIDILFFSGDIII